MALSRLSALGLCVGSALSCTAQPTPTFAPIVAAPLVPSALAAAPVAEPASSASRDSFWISGPASQGALLTGRVPDGTVSLSLDGQPVKVESDGFFLFGLDRDAGPTSKLVATLRGGAKVEHPLSVTPFKWALSYVNTPATGGAKDEADLAARRPAELAQIGAARAKNTDAKGWRQEMVWPVKYWTIPGGRISGQFGRQRFYQGKPGSPHGGLDIAAANGTLFYAPADGVVVLAARDAPFTLEGHLLLIDHGNGLNSAFLHCSQLLVSEGDRVSQGQLLGKVGMTGRTAGAHLHWGLRWNAARVDPLRLVPKPPAPKPVAKKKP
jgi:murein DD-endopeptidase MepM/ murein hydrolase activator NlpD